jgi:hypothetical protein
VLSEDKCHFSHRAHIVTQHHIALKQHHTAPHSTETAPHSTTQHHAVSFVRYSKQFIAFVSRCLQKCASDRPSAQELLVLTLILSSAAGVPLLQFCRCSLCFVFNSHTPCHCPFSSYSVCYCAPPFYLQIPQEDPWLSMHPSSLENPNDLRKWSALCLASLLCCLACFSAIKTADDARPLPDPNCTLTLLKLSCNLTLNLGSGRRTRTLP